MKPPTIEDILRPPAPGKLPTMAPPPSAESIVEPEPEQIDEDTAIICRPFIRAGF
jgi:hypothetical protein